jgi:plasmid segregation protein ParM
MSDKKEEIIVRAIDLGYNGTKFTKIVNAEKVEYGHMPSLAIVANDDDDDGSGFDLDFFDDKDTVKVIVNGMTYEVGPDVMDAQTTNSTRVLHDQYIQSDQYMALHLGALYYMGETKIDLLVLGLPIDNSSLANELKEKLTGDIVVNSSLTVSIKNVLILPQAYGAFQSVKSKHPDMFEDEDTVTLIVDPGYYTFDFATIKGNNRPKLIKARSGSKEGGINLILRGISDSISRVNLGGKKYENYEAIDKALSDEKRSIKVAGEVIELNDHIKNTGTMIESVIDYMRNIVGDGIKDNIDNIIIIGGNPDIFKKNIFKKYPTHASKDNIKSPDGSIFSNAEGYYLYGLSVADKIVK